jgi:hypothetical protein
MAAAVERELKTQRDDLIRLSDQVRKLESIAGDLKTFIEIFRANQDNFKTLLLDIKETFENEIKEQKKHSQELEDRVEKIERVLISISWQLRIQYAFVLFLMGTQMNDISKWTVKIAKAIGGA